MMSELLLLISMFSTVRQVSAKCKLHRYNDSSKNSGCQNHWTYFLIAIWRWPWSFSRTVAKLHCWTLRRTWTLLRYVVPSVCRNTANDMSRPFVCHLSVTLFRFTQTVELLSNIFAPSNSLETRTLCSSFYEHYNLLDLWLCFKIVTKNSNSKTVRLCARFPFIKISLTSVAQSCINHACCLFALCSTHRQSNE